MTTPYDAIYLAPHLDDAVLSCGGQIYDRVQAGHKILVLTIMAGEPASEQMNEYIASLHSRWELEGSAVRQRQAEDIAAVTGLGAAYEHWSLPDCIYRGEPPYYVGDEAIFGPIHPDEMAVVADLAAQMGALAANEIIAPLAMGNHVDHQLVRAAAEQQIGPRLLYYEDYPYVQRDGAPLEALAADPAWQAHSWPVTPAGRQAKFAAIARYRSQLSTFFADDEDLRSQVGGYMDNVGGERTWRRIGDRFA